MTRNPTYFSGGAGNREKRTNAQDLHGQARRDCAGMVRRRCQWKDAGASGDGDCPYPAGQAQAAVHAPRGRGRLCHRHQRREDCGDGAEAGSEAILSSTPAIPVACTPSRSAACWKSTRSVSSASRSRACSPRTVWGGGC